MSNKIGIGEVRRGKEWVNRKEKGMKNDKKEGNNKKIKEEDHHILSKQC